MGQEGNSPHNLELTLFLTKTHLRPKQIVSHLTDLHRLLVMSLSHYNHRQYKLWLIRAQWNANLWCQMLI